ncbi:putative nuclease HARBI1 [Hyla sarda]|uniref:putative nuclease HARBI1 n=1 Tax=Hyla sarda TaxID=327740 RepID=UPI0024C39A22|nr:putative nuclease HARBI1 [Hyla sarda]
MLNVAKDYIKFPASMEEIQAIKEQFYNIAGFPNVLGAIDCTHVALVPPADSEHVYRNRKMYRSINVQVLVGPNLQILDIVPNYPGSCHDSFILQGTELFRRFQRGDYGDSLILGDNGYRLSSWLMTPYLNPRTPAEQRYNLAHKNTRSIVERTFGILKSRFRCLDVSGGALLYKPKIVCQIIIACAILHNIANKHNIETPLADDLRAEIQINLDQNIPADNAGQLLRQHITNQYFA